METSRSLKATEIGGLSWCLFQISLKSYTEGMQQIDLNISGTVSSPNYFSSLRLCGSIVLFKVSRTSATQQLKEKPCSMSMGKYWTLNTADKMLYHVVRLWNKYVCKQNVLHLNRLLICSSVNNGVSWEGLEKSLQSESSPIRSIKLQN